jgi:hypothetical protein
MLKAQNELLNAIDINSEKQQNITENEWIKINKDKMNTDEFKISTNANIIDNNIRIEK